MINPDVTAEIAVDSGTRVVCVKIQSPTYELNVFLNAVDVERLLTVTLPVVPEQPAVCIGESCGATAYWSRDPNRTMGIVMGHDDTTWDFGAWMPSETFDTIRKQVSELKPQL